VKRHWYGWKIYDSIRSVQGKTTLAIVDGAAFGSEIGKVLRYLETSRANCTLYAPESFEYLILSAGLMDVPKGILQETYLYADSKVYMSWEEYYSSYLADITRNTVYQYSKLRLTEAYKTQGAVAKIAAVMPETIR